MKTSELIGKRIIDIKDKIGTYDDSNELLTSDGVIQLDSGEVLEIPYRNSEIVSFVEKTLIGYSSIFNEEGFFKRLFSKVRYNKEVANRNKKAMKGKVIVGIYQFEEEGIASLAEKMIIELESGYVIGEVGMSPFGTGAAGLYVFNSKKELEDEYEERLIKVY